ncbi:MAG: glycosyltransferase family 2 protein [Synechococcales cyanobacterium M58_A2018_015]|nr:glycosyltransferase family 2 protein [Synechococcales cyanobacterium M58_A2018_015]
MQGNSWQENDSYNELEPISSLLSEFSDSFGEPEDDDPRFTRGFAGRRRKAALALTVIWSGTVALHLSTWGSWLVIGLTTLMGIHALRVLLARPIPLPEPLYSDDLADYPQVSLMVAAKNEEAVIGRLVENLCTLDYPTCRYEVWIIDDNSSDRTPIVLERLKQTYPQLHVVRRSANASGGKSGALNQVLPKTSGEIVAVFDADAQVPPDLLRRVVPMFERERVGAVQVRKAITNATANVWTRGQAVEMVFDAYIQQQRIAIGGIGELRGNGQFVRRDALEHCGGWNEETITDDLDLTIRLHLDRWDVDLLMLPAVGEEGVTNAIGLWHQRNRWAEGGYQRYLDYWRMIVRNRMGTGKTVDLFMFLISQYLLPTAAVPDCLMALLRNCPPLLIPITSLSLTLSILGMFIGLRQVQTSLPDGPTPRRRLPSIFITGMQTLLGVTYMLHWIPVMSSTTTRMAFRPKRLKWVKTVHHGSGEWLDAPDPS